MRNHHRLKDLIESTQWIDTHEHVVEEHHRLRPGPYRFELVGLREEFAVPDDWTSLLAHYAINDLSSAGLPDVDRVSFLEGEMGPREKWRLIEPYWDAVRHGGYVRAANITAKALCGVMISSETCVEIDEALKGLRRPGYYRELLVDRAGVSMCHVHSLDHDPFCESEYPDLLAQDISLVPLVLGRHPDAERASGIEVSTLDDYLAVIDRVFERYASRAVAAKCLWAYLRPLETQPVPIAPNDSFERLRAGNASDLQRREVEDFLFDVCVRLAGENNLPVKMHMGTLDSNGQPELPYVQGHVNAGMALAERYPETRFVFMHMAWPHQEQLLSVAKHYANVNIDLSWSWILAPMATQEFVSRFLTSAPANKLLCFGGDYLVAESIVGHAQIARAGLRGALEDLVEARWLDITEACELVPMLMRGNAEALFGAPPTAAR
jgi:hypothetical protein